MNTYAVTELHDVFKLPSLILLSWYIHIISSGSGTVIAAQLMWTFSPTIPDCVGDEVIFGGPKMSI